MRPSRRHSIRALAFGALAFGAALAAGPVRLGAQAPARSRSERGQPRTPFSTTDFGKLRWLEGVWEAQAPEQPTLYERYHFLNDSTIEISYYRDPQLTQETGSGRVYLTVGRVYHTFGAGRWGATNVDSTGAFFIPQVNAHNTFAWSYKTPNSWTMTMRSSLSGRDHITVYQLERIPPP